MSLDVSSIPPAPLPLYTDVVAGFNQTPRTIPCKYLYDDRGSQLFNEICDLDEYYPTRTELHLTRKYLEQIAAHIGTGARLVELGAGSGLKTRFLLSQLLSPHSYLPVDISPMELRRCANTLREDYPDLPITPICVDYTADWQLPTSSVGGRTVFYYPGSTIGNFYPRQACGFLKRLSHLADPDGGLLIGVDLHKDTALLEAAYNDRQGVTAEFNRNLLRRINRECGADFDLDRFDHLAVYDENLRRIEMRLISTCRQTVNFPNDRFSFERGEYILTEVSHKYAIEDFANLAEEAHWRTRAFWTDRDQLFSLWYLERESVH